MTDTETDEYRVSRQQGGRGAKPVVIGGTPDGDVLVAEPGDTFEVPADTDLSAFDDRVVPADAPAPDASDASNGTGDGAASAAGHDAEPPRERDAEAAAETASDAAPDAETGPAEQAAEQATDAADDAADAAADADGGPVQPDAVAERIGYAEAGNVDEVRDLVRDADLSEREKRALVRYEQANADRKTAKEAIKGA